MLVVQFCITDPYHSLTMLSFLMLVHSPTQELDASATASSYRLAIHGESDTITSNMTQYLSLVHDKFALRCPDIHSDAPIVNPTHENASLVVHPSTSIYYSGNISIAEWVASTTLWVCDVTANAVYERHSHSQSDTEGASV